ncbi:MAG: hypothetical protein [Bacteriophage sp.]|nr:MAG: hypothetical protein [Bacteriophage sp.]
MKTFLFNRAENIAYLTPDCIVKILDKPVSHPELERMATTLFPTNKATIPASGCFVEVAAMVPLVIEGNDEHQLERFARVVQVIYHPDNTRLVLYALDGAITRQKLFEGVLTEDVVCEINESVAYHIVTVYPIYPPIQESIDTTTEVN